MRNLHKLSVLTILLAVGGSAMGADLRVEVGNAGPANGHVYFALFDSATAYDAFEMTARARSEGTSEPLHAVFSDLAAGEYTVAVFQDTNGNRRLDMNAQGIPIEPYGFSQNAVGYRGRPEFKAAAVTLPMKDETLTVVIDLTSHL